MLDQNYFRNQHNFDLTESLQRTDSLRDETTIIKEENVYDLKSDANSLFQRREINYNNEMGNLNRGSNVFTMQSNVQSFKMLPNTMTNTEKNDLLSKSKEISTTGAFNQNISGDLKENKNTQNILPQNQKIPFSFNVYNNFAKSNSGSSPSPMKPNLTKNNLNKMSQNCGAIFEGNKSKLNVVSYGESEEEPRPQPYTFKMNKLEKNEREVREWIMEMMFVVILMLLMIEVRIM